MLNSLLSRAPLGLSVPTLTTRPLRLPAVRVLSAAAARLVALIAAPGHSGMSLVGQTLPFSFRFSNERHTTAGKFRHDVTGQLCMVFAAPSCRVPMLDINGLLLRR